VSGVDLPPWVGKGAAADAAADVENPLPPWVQRIAQEDAREKFGFWQVAPAMAMDAGNAALNAIADTGSTVLKAAAGGAGAVIGTAAPLFGGEFQPLEMAKRGWRGAAGDIKAFTGSENPGWGDYLRGSIARTFGEDPNKLYKSVLREDWDEDFEASLRGAHTVAETVGQIVAMASSPGQMVAKPAMTVAAPLARWAEGAIVKGVAEKYLTKEVAKTALREGRVWAELAKLPEWKQAAQLSDKLRLATGKTISDTIGMGAANIAQSFAMSPDSDRIAAMEGAAFMAPFMGPIMGAGTLAGKLITNSRLVPDAVKAAIFKDVEEVVGRGLPTPTLAQRVRGHGAIGLANVLSSSLEGSAFAAAGDWDGFWADASEAFGDNPDPEAAGRFWGRVLGSSTGVLIAKYGIPYQDLPYFRRNRPDIDRFLLHLEGQQAKEALTAKEQATPQAEGAPSAETPLSEMPLAPPEAVKRPSFRIDEEGVETSQGRFLNPKQQDPIKQAAATYEKVKPVARHANVLLDAGWNVVGDVKADGDVATLELGPDNVTFQQSGDSVSISVPNETFATIRQWGGEDVATEPTGGTVRLHGADAEEFLNRMAQVSMARRVMMAIDAARLGYEDKGDLGWFDPKEGVYLRQALDGSLLRRRVDRGTWAKQPGVLLTEPPKEGPIFGAPSFEAMAAWQAAKEGMVPEPLTDTITDASLHYAAFYDTPRAREARALINELWPNGQPSDVAQALLKKDTDQLIGWTLGQVVAGESTAKQAMDRLRGVQAGDVPADAPLDALYQPDRPADPIADKNLSARTETQDPAPVENPTVPEKPKTIANMLPSQGELYSGIPVPKAVTRALMGEAESGSRGILRTVSEKLFTPIPEALAKRATTPQAREAIDLARQQQSRARVLYNELDAPMQEADAALKRAGKPLAVEPLEGAPETWGLSKFRQLNEGLREPRTAQEAAVRDSSRQWSKENFGTLVRAGTLVEDGGRYVPMQASEGNKVPRLPGSDFGTVFGSERLRRQLAREVYDLPQNSRLRQRFKDVAAFEKWWESLYNPRKQNDPKNLERQANAEIHRMVDVMPDQWQATPGGRKYEVFETNPFDLMRRAADRYTRRAATVETFGQNLPKAEREQRGITKRGLDETMEDLRTGIDSGGETQQWREVVDMFATYMQGGEGQKAGTLTRAIRPVENWVRGAMTWASFVRDIADPGAVLPSLVGHVNVLKAIKQVATGAEGVTPKDIFAMAFRDGAYIRDAGELALGEGGSAGANLRNLITLGNRTSERVKAVVAHRAAQLLLDGYSKGNVVGGDANILKGFGFNETQAQLLMSDEAPDSLKTRLKQEVVKMATSQYRPGEGSLIHANPNFQAAFRFTKFTVGRLHALYKVAQSSKVMFDKTAPIGDRVAAASRMLSVMAGVTISAAFGELLARMIREGPFDGAKNFANAMEFAPAQYTAQMVAGSTFGTAGSQLQAVASDPQDAGNFANLTAPTALAYEFLMAVNGQRSYAGMTPQQRAFTAARRMGFIPFGSQLEGIMALTGIDPDQRRDLARRVAEFKRFEGIETGTSGDKDRSDAFYVAMRAARQAIGNHPEDQNAAWNAAMAELETAARAEGKGAVADSLQASKLLGGLDAEQRASLRSFLGSEDEFRSILMQDEMMTAVAHAARGRLPEKEQIDPLLPRLELASGLARAGDPNAFREAYTETIDRAKASALAGAGIPGDLQTLASTMGQFPERLGAYVGDRDALILSRMDAATATNYLYYLLTKRVISSTKETLRARALEEALPK
jgi:hypothetical protein